MQERLLVQQLGAPGFFHVIARYGYAQRKEQGDGFVQAGFSFPFIWFQFL